MWAGLRSQVDEDSVCRCEIVGFGEIRASTIGASEHDEWYNVSINYKDGEGLFYTLFTYKEPPSSFRLTILKKPVLTNCSRWRFYRFISRQQINIHIYIYIYFYFEYTFSISSIHVFFIVVFFSLIRAIASAMRRGYCANIRRNLCKPFVSIFLPGLKDESVRWKWNTSLFIRRC